MHTWFHVLSNQKILKGIYYLPIRLSVVSWGFFQVEMNTWIFLFILHILIHCKSVNLGFVSLHQPVPKNQIRNFQLFFFLLLLNSEKRKRHPLLFWNCNNNKNQKKFLISYLVFSHWLMQWNKPWGLGVLVTMPSSFLSTNSPSVKLISLWIDSSGFDDAGKYKIN